MAQPFISTSAFKRKVKKFYKDHKRTLPWRETRNPYHILVSEIMLQQTQVDRVIPKYLAWLAKFPTVLDLANAPQREVITAWQGLGYNRRGLNLKRAAEKVMQDFNGEIPHSISELVSLPGVGPYTSAAVATFAFNQSHMVIETNIRTVYIHEFFPDRVSVHDNEIIPLIEETIDHKNPREWYWALMDYGSYLKKEFPNPSRKSRHYTKQSEFTGSNREVRGYILRELTKQSPQPLTGFLNDLPFDQTRIKKSLQALQQEGFITQDSESIWLK